MTPPARRVSGERFGLLLTVPVHYPCRRRCRSPSANSSPTCGKPPTSCAAPSMLPTSRPSHSLSFFQKDVYDEDTRCTARVRWDEEYASFPQNYRFQIPERCHWSAVRVVTTNVGNALQKAMRGIEKANPTFCMGSSVTLSGRTRSAFLTASSGSHRTLLAEQPGRQRGRPWPVVTTSSSRNSPTQQIASKGEGVA